MNEQPRSVVRRKIRLKPRQAHQQPVWPALLQKPPAPLADAVVAAPAAERLWGLRPRTIISVVRTLLFGALLVFLASRPAQLRGWLDAAVYGAVFADYLTWFIWSFLMLPRHLVHGLYEAGLNIALGVVLSGSWQVDWRGDATGELLACTFLSFLLVCGLKAVFLSVTLLENLGE